MGRPASVILSPQETKSRVKELTEEINTKTKLMKDGGKAYALYLKEHEKKIKDGDRDRAIYLKEHEKKTKAREKEVVAQSKEISDLMNKKAMLGGISSAAAPAAPVL